MMTGEYVIIRSRDAGCFAGELVTRKDSEVTLYNARRLWYWDGAATLSELAMTGTSRPHNCRFPVAVAKIVVLRVCEVITVTDVARKSIESVKVWHG